MYVNIVYFSHKRLFSYVYKDTQLPVTVKLHGNIPFLAKLHYCIDLLSYFFLN